MKNNLLLIFSLFLSVQVYAQPFSKAFTHGQEFNTTQYGLVNTNGTSVLAITALDQTIQFRDIAMVYINNADGTNAATYTCQTVDNTFSISANEVVVLSNGNLMVSGIYSLTNQAPYHPALFVVDENGAIVWAKKIDASIGTSPKLTMLSDNSILVSLDYNNGSQHRVLFKMDQLGNASDFYELSTTENALQISPQPSAFNLLLSDGNLLNISNDLTTINWQRKYFHAIGITFSLAANGDYLWATSQVAFPGHMTVFRTTSTGQVTWVKYVESHTSLAAPFDIVGFHFIQEDTQGNIIVSASSEGGLNGALQVVFDGDGNYLSNYKINTFKNNLNLIDANSYFASGFVGFGSLNATDLILEKRQLATPFECDATYVPTITNGDEMELTPDNISLSSTADLVFTDIALNISSSITQTQNHCTITPISVTENEVFNTGFIYPNPSSNEVYMNLSKQAFPAPYIIRNALGQEVLAGTLHTTTRPINIHSLKKGLYFIEVATKPQPMWQRFVKN